MFLKAIRPTTLTLALLGMSSKRGKHAIEMYFWHAVGVVFVMLTSIALVRTLYFLELEHGIKGSFTEFGNAAWDVQIIVMAIYFMYWLRIDLVGSIERQLLVATGCAGCEVHRVELYRFQIGYIAFTGINVLVANAGVVLYWYGDEYSKLIFYMPLSAFVLTWVSLVWFAGPLLFAVCCYALLFEFRHFHTRLNEAREKLARPEVLQAFMQQHKQLADVSDLLNNAFAGFSLWMLVIDVPNTIMYCYGTLYSLLVVNFWDAVMPLVFGVGWMAVHLFIVIWMPALLVDESYRLAYAFFERLQNTPIGIDLRGFGVITKPLIFAVASLSLTYYTLLIQFIQPGRLERDFNDSISAIAHASDCKTITTQCINILKMC